MREPRGQIETKCKESESSQGQAADQRRLGLQRDASVGTHWLPEDDMGQEV